jgi:DNA-binding NtrC family response regulator
VHITAKALEELERREWPGNVRELKQTIERAALRATGSMIQLEDLPPARSFEDAAFAPTSRHATLQEAVRQWTAERLASDQQRITEENVSWEAMGTLYEDCLNVVELPLLKSVLEFHSMNRAAAASHLGLHRSTLRQKMRRYNIE